MPSYPDTDVTSFVLERAQELGDKPALIDGPTGRAVTYSELDQATRALAAGLAERGFGRGDCLCVYMPNLPEYAIAFHGVARAGGKASTANPLYTARELQHQLEDSGSKYLLTIPAVPGRGHQKRPRRRASRRSSSWARRRARPRSPS